MAKCHVRRFSVYTEKKRQGVRGAIKLINSSSNRGRFFQYAGRCFSGYTEKSARGVAAGINSGSIRGRFFQYAGAFFSVCGSPVTCFAVTRETRVLKKTPAGFRWGLIRAQSGCVFSVCGGLFSCYTENKRTPAGRPIN